MEQKYLRIIAAILVPIVVYLFSFGIVAFHYPTYEKFIEENSLHKGVAKSQTKNIIAYFQGKEELYGFTAEETTHLNDVKWLIRLLIVAALLGFFALLLIADRKAILYGGIACLVLPVLLYLLPFASLFDWFHRISFPAGGWILDSSALLIQMYPLEFFYSFFKDILIRGFIFGLVITLIARYRE
jgi:integral membrane protein (TIGR01906 family)